MSTAESIGPGIQLLPEPHTELALSVSVESAGFWVVLVLLVSGALWWWRRRRRR